MTSVTSLVPPAVSGPAWVALQNDLGDKVGPSPTETVGEGIEAGNPPLGKPSTAFSQGQAECRGYLLLTLRQALAGPEARSLLGLVLPLPSLL